MVNLRFIMKTNSRAQFSEAALGKNTDYSALAAIALRSTSTSIFCTLTNVHSEKLFADFGNTAFEACCQKQPYHRLSKRQAWLGVL